MRISNSLKLTTALAAVLSFGVTACDNKPKRKESQILIQDIETTSPGTTIKVLESDRDGVVQISEFLDDYRNVGSIHILSHGADGQVALGNSSLSSSSLAGYAQQVASWSSALSADADILFYGCDLASSAQGESLIASLAELTNADIAASDDLTGHEDLGGDWDLEVTSGQIESEVVISDSLQASWQHVLATSESHLFLTGSGIPDANLNTAIPTATSIPDYDDSRHSPLGTLIDKGGIDEGETDLVKHQEWRLGTDGTAVDGPVSLTIWSHIKDFNNSKNCENDIKPNCFEKQPLISR